MNEEQKGYINGSLDCKEQLIIDSIIYKQARRENKNIYTAFIDYYYKIAYEKSSEFLTNFRCLIDSFRIRVTISQFTRSTGYNWELFKTTVLDLVCKHSSSISIKRSSTKP
ncbi:uncharacterized protein LOC135128861 [Zophobas morio]|uniref:uncharacterized protein LOC135128861 n=1 Tax=Zophobas morio TaxID=2755281 RepID=UPI003083915C